MTHVQTHRSNAHLKKIDDEVLEGVEGFYNQLLWVNNPILGIQVKIISPKNGHFSSKLPNSTNVLLKQAQKPMQC